MLDSVDDLLVEIRKSSLDNYIKIVNNTLHDINGYVNCYCNELHVKKFVNIKAEALRKLNQRFKNFIFYEEEELPFIYDNEHKSLPIKNLFKNETTNK